MEVSLIVALISLIAGPVAVGISFYLNRNKYNVDVHVAEAQADRTNVETMTVIVKELKENVRDLEAKLDNANIKIDVLLKENISLQTQIAGILTENIALRKDIERAQGL